MHACNCIDSNVTFVSISDLTALFETKSKQSHKNVPTSLNLMRNYVNLADTTKFLLILYISDWIHTLYGVCLSQYPSLLNSIYFKITTRIYSRKAITAPNPLIQKFTYLAKKKYNSTDLHVDFCYKKVWSSPITCELKKVKLLIKTKGT